MKRRTKIIIAVVVLLAIAGITAASINSKSKEGTPVTFGKVERADLTSKVTANGRIDAKRKVDLSANVMGQIVNLAVREGDVVKKGDFLLQIDQKQLAASARGSRGVDARALLRPRCRARQRSPRRSATSSARSSNYEREDHPAGRARPRAHRTRFRARERRRDRAAHRAGARERRRGARHALEDHHDRADGRHHHRPSRRGRRGRGHRHDEQPRHEAADDRRHERRRGGDGSRRDRHPEREGRPARHGHDRRLSEQDVRRRGHRGGLEPDDALGREHRHGSGQLRSEDPARRIRPRACVPASPPPRTSSPARARRRSRFRSRRWCVREKPGSAPRQGAGRGRRVPPQGRQGEVRSRHDRPHRRQRTSRS